MTPKVMMHKITGELTEMTHSWIGFVIWLADYDSLDPSKSPTPDEMIFDDDERFKDYIEIGEC